MKKKILAILLAIFFLALCVWAGVFYWKNLRGIWPAIEKPSQNISELIPEIKTDEKTSENLPLKMPAGFSISIFAKDLGDARVMAYDPVGNLLVSTPAHGKVIALKDVNGDGFAEQNVTVIEGLNYPHGLAFRCPDSDNLTKCQLYIAESDQVATYDYDEKNLKAINKKKIIELPGSGVHVSRTLMFMPYPNENRLLVSVGSSCNVCHEKDSDRAKILSADHDGSDLKVFAKGLRNAVFMAIHPVNGKIWATEMGRDFLGDNLPPDEINIVEEGKNYGWPICYGKNVHDTDFDKNIYIRNPCMEPFEIPSHIDVPAHSAPLGLAFVPEEGWPQDYWYNALVAYHGSWNRSVPTGYKVVRYKLDEKGNYLGEEDFIYGWLTKDGVLGRPVDILIQPGGVIYISDDKAEVIYRVIYREKQ